MVVGMTIGFFLVYRHQFFFNTQNIKTPQGFVHKDATVVSPQGVHISVLVADTDKKRASGLSGFSRLKDKQGMLFVFPQVGIYPFWMKDMNFPLDIIWMDQNNMIIDRTINIVPESYPETFTAKASVASVLELPANTADKYGFSVGSYIQVQNNK